jgi:protein phosphatase 1 regulatory subunit 7
MHTHIHTHTDLANNKIKELKGLSSLTKLRKIDLGANRIRFMDEAELSGLVNLEELWIGKNKIEEIRGLEKVRRVIIVMSVG